MIYDFVNILHIFRIVRGSDGLLFTDTLKKVRDFFGFTDKFREGVKKRALGKGHN